METMRALQVPEPGRHFELVRREMPQVSAGEVRVRVEACGICYSDSFAMSGIPGAAYPLIPGHEISGVVDAVKSDVRSWTPGDRVGVGWFGGQCGRCPSCRRGSFVTCTALRTPGLMVDGGYAEYVVVPETALARVPDGMDPVVVGPLMCAGVTAFNALRRGAARTGERVAVLGIGGVGHLAVQFARHMGCETIAISRGRAKEALALKLGAHHFIDVLDPGAVDRLLELGGADVIVATAPSSAEVSRLIAGAAAQGRIVLTGFSLEPVRISTLDVIARNLSIIGSPAGTSMDAEETLRVSSLNGIEPVVEEFPLEAASQAYEKMLASDINFRAVLKMESGPSANAGLDVQGSEKTIDMAQPSPALLSSDTDPVLDCPYDEFPDVDALVQAAVRWHFSPETGSPFWLERAKKLDFDPIKDVHDLAGLRLFPNIVNELRQVRAHDLIPRGYGAEPGLYGVFESGGVTGPPKRVILLNDWMERWFAASLRYAEDREYPKGIAWAIVAPTGPHLMTAMSLESVRRTGGMAFTIDLDPRWIRRCLEEGRTEEADRYIDHLIAQTGDILETQDVQVLTITPPLLERLAQKPKLVDLVRRKIQLITWGGTHMDADTRHFLRTELFPGVTFQGGYGSTMVLGGCAERPVLGDEDPCVFDPFPPYITLSVVDPETGEAVPYGERGRVVMNHVSKSMFIPNNLERDTAIRVPGLPGQAGDSVADVMPVAQFQGGQVTEGVY